MLNAPQNIQAVPSAPGYEQHNSFEEHFKATHVDTCRKRQLLPDDDLSLKYNIIHSVNTLLKEKTDPP